MRKIVLLFAVIVTIAIGTTGIVLAFPSVYHTWDALYPDSASDDNVVDVNGSPCQLCHVNLLGGEPWNAYGWSIRELVEAGATFEEAIVAVENLNSDEDPTGSTNLLEINSDTQPGWTDGPNNIIHFRNNSISTGQLPPAGFALDPVFEPVPNLSQWGLITFAILLGSLVFWGVRRKILVDLPGTHT